MVNVTAETTVELNANATNGNSNTLTARSDNSDAVHFSVRDDGVIRKLAAYLLAIKLKLGQTVKGLS